MNSLSKELIELRGDVDKDYSNVGKWIEYINQLKRHGFNDHALSASREACSMNSSSPELFIIQIKLLKELNLKDDRIQILTDCAQNFPNDFGIQLWYGESLKHQNKLEQALLVFESCKTINAKSIWPYILSATTLMKLGQKEDSYEEILIAEKLDSKDQRIQFTKGQLESELGRIESAVNSFKQVITVDAKHPLAPRAAIEILNITRKEQGDEAALVESKKHIEIFPENLEISIAYAKCLIALQRINDAQSLLIKTLEKWPNNVRSVLLLKGVLNRKGQQSDAIQLLVDQQKVHPQDYSINIHIAHQYSLMNKRRRAIEAFKQSYNYANNQNQKNNSTFHIANEYKALGNYELALETIARAPRHSEPIIRLQHLEAKLRVKLNQPTEAKRIYEDILSKDKASIKTAIELANLYGNIGHVDKAIELLQEKLRLLPEQVELQLNLAKKFTAVNDNDRAIGLYKKILNVEPEHIGALTGITQCYSNKGDWGKALETLNTCSIPEHRAILRNKANILMRLGRYDEASQVNQTNRENNDDVQAVFQQAQILSNQGLFDQANEILDKIEVERSQWISKVCTDKGNNYFLQYHYAEAVQEFIRGIEYSENPLNLRNRLALLYMLEGNLTEARKLLLDSTKDIEQRNTGGKIRVPLRSHCALVINDMRSDPGLLHSLMKTFELADEKKVKAIAQIVTKNPNYLGSSIYLMRRLRTQGIFADLKPTDRQRIPKVIVQYWDQETRPVEVVEMMNSWKEKNPEYEHKLYSAKSAYEFLSRKYNQNVVQAFKNCEGPAMQADFFRLAYLNKYGGFYADADDMCIKGLDDILSFELVVLQEDFATIGNNFIGAIPAHPVIKFAFDCVVQNLSEYCNENAWFKTGPAILTNAMAIYISQYIISDEQLPSVKVLSISELRSLINQHMPMSYKRTNKSWFKQAYERDIKISI